MFDTISERSVLTLQSANQNCRSQHSKYFFYFFSEKIRWHFMWTVCYTYNLHEMSSIIFSEKKNNKQKKVNKVSSAALLWLMVCNSNCKITISYDPYR